MLSLRALAERFELGESQCRQIHTLIELVASDPLAPTTITSPTAVLRDHIADSLVALELAPVRCAERVADLGAGAGFPGFPLAIALTNASVHLVESSHRKCEFLARARQRVAAENAIVVPARAEEWSEGLSRCDLVVARALAPLAVVAEYAAPLLSLGGSLVAWRGRRDLEDEAAGRRAAAILGLEPAEPIRVVPYPDAMDRHLHPMVKVASTPARFPRRPGMARKRPLG